MYKNILLPLDLNSVETQHKAIQTAVELARTFGASLQVLTVVPDFGMSIVAQHFPKDYAENALAETHAKLGAFASEHIPDGIKKTLMVSQGTIYEEIIRAADKVSADLVVVSSHRPSLKDYLLGPNAARVVRHFKRSVLVVRE